MRGLLVGVWSLGVASSAFAGSWAPGVKATLPTGAASAGQGVILSQVSCAAAGDCAAVGNYLDSSGSRQGVLLTEAAGRWRAGVKATLPANAAANPQVFLTGVSCGAAGNCAAIGMYNDSAGNQQGLLLTESSGKWSAGVEATMPGGVTSAFVFLKSVSCGSARSCTAVGSYSDSSGSRQAVLLTASSGKWAAGVQPALPANALSSYGADLSSVSCVSAGDCTAVGQYVESSGYYQGLLLTRAAGAWSTGVEASMPAGAAAQRRVDVTSVSCASAGTCAAAGLWDSLDNKIHGVLLNESAGRWSVGVEVTPPAADAGTSSYLSTGPVSCGAAGSCTAVARYSEFPHGFLLTESGGEWSAGVEPPVPADTASGTVNLQSVSCASAGSCAAVGTLFDLSSTSQQGLLLSKASGRWATGVEATLPADASYIADLNSVSCASPGNCTAVGTYGDGAGNIQGLLSSQSVRPRLSALRVSVGRTLTVSYRLDVPATVTFTVRRRGGGRVPGQIVRHGKAGANRFRIAGRKLGGPGDYRLTATPRAGGQAGHSHSVPFSLAA